jgi:hypothetical protein
MKYNSKNSIALSLMMLILFSTIGFNVIKTFCGGCEMEMVKVAYSISAQEGIACDCCDGDTHESDCCKSATPAAKSNPTKSFLVKLKFDSTEAKGKVNTIQLPSTTIHFIVANINLAKNIFNVLISRSDLSPPPLSGRSILTSICVFRI